MKNIFKNTVMGIGIALGIFCLIGIVIDISYHGNFEFRDYSFTKMVLGCLVTGIGFGAPAAVYHNDHLPLPIKAIIHMGIGCTIYTITAFLVGWIPMELGIGKCLIIISCELAVSFLIWLGFMLHYKKMAQKMNERIQKIKE